MNNYEAGHYAATEEAMKAIRVLTERLAAARIDSAEWKEQHENLLAMFRASENRAAKAEAALRACRPEEVLPDPAKALAAKLNELDAARYRYIRNTPPWQSDLAVVLSENVEGDISYITQEGLDGMIDSALGVSPLRRVE